MTVDKKSLSERDICTQFITPAIQRAGWDLETQVREEVTFTAGQVIVKGKTIKRKRQTSRLRLVLSTESAHRSSGGEGQQPPRRRWDAAGA